MNEPALLADVGGTNVRLALASPDGSIRSLLVLRAQDFDSLDHAVETYLQRIEPAKRPKLGAFAVASPVYGDEVELTNRAWSFSIDALRSKIGLEHLAVINDFTAVALGLPRLTSADVERAGGDAPLPGFPVAVLGPGTGLGVSAIIPDKERWLAIAGEGGHVTASAADDHEARILDWLRIRIGHVSAERVLSGTGLVNLYEAESELAGEAAESLTPNQITTRALEGSCTNCRRAVDDFFSFLGTHAGNLALSFGARGGVYVAGGIVPRMLPLFHVSRYRERFEAKGRFQKYLKAIPSWVIIGENPALHGLVELAFQNAGKAAR